MPQVRSLSPRPSPARRCQSPAATGFKHQGQVATALRDWHIRHLRKPFTIRENRSLWDTSSGKDRASGMLGSTPKGPFDVRAARLDEHCPPKAEAVSSILTAGTNDPGWPSW